MGRSRCAPLFCAGFPGLDPGQLGITSPRCGPRRVRRRAWGPGASLVPTPASPPARHPPPRRCGWRAPRLTLQLGGRLAIGLKIATPARWPAGAGAEPPQPELILSPRGRFVQVLFSRCAALFPRPAALRGHAAPGRPVQRAGRRREDGCRGPGRAAGASYAHDPRAQVGGPRLQERVRLLLRLPGKEDPRRSRAAGLGNGVARRAGDPMSCGLGTFSSSSCFSCFGSLAPSERLWAAADEDWVLWALRSASLWLGCQGPGRQHSAQSPSFEKGKQELD